MCSCVCRFLHIATQLVSQTVIQPASQTYPLRLDSADNRIRKVLFPLGSIGSLYRVSPGNNDGISTAVIPYIGFHPVVLCLVNVRFPQVCQGGDFQCRIATRCRGYPELVHIRPSMGIWCGDIMGKTTRESKWGHSEAAPFQDETF